MSSTILKNAEGIRVLTYCHDSVGIGHLRRTINICNAISQAVPATSILTVTGTPFWTMFDASRRWDWLKLPSLIKSGNGVYGAKAIQLDLSALIQWRSSLLLDTVTHFQPDILIVDKAPVGVCGELRSSLNWLREHRPQCKMILGLRDIEDDPKRTIDQWNALDATRVMADIYDEVWVYGMQELFDIADHYELSSVVAKKLRYMGFVCDTHCNHPPASNGSRSVLVTVGGGTDGAPLLETYLQESAHRVAETGWRSVLVAGPDIGVKDMQRLRDLAQVAPQVQLLDTAPCSVCLMREAQVVVTMGGYNTLCEAVALRKPTLVVPRTEPRREQAIRAEIWQRHGLVQMIDPATLSPTRLADRVVELCDSPVPLRHDILDMGGLSQVVECFKRLFSNGIPSHAPAVCVQ